MNENNKIFGIIVIYNQSVEDSVTYKCLKSYGNIRLIVCDNSTKNFDNEKKVAKDGYVYISMNGNAGLSKAYNKGLDAIQKENPEMQGYVVLLDDDTHIPEEYFTVLRQEIEKNSGDIYLPIVQDEVGILSPSIMKKYYCHCSSEDVWSIKQEELCGINSGMAINLQIFRKYRYNEEIFLDYVDHNFLRDMCIYKKKVVILNVKIRQTFSSNTDSKEKALIRFKIFKKDINVFYKKGFWNRFFYYYVITRRKMQLSRQFRDITIMFR